MLKTARTREGHSTCTHALATIASVQTKQVSCLARDVFTRFLQPSLPSNAQKHECAKFELAYSMTGKGDLLRKKSMSHLTCRIAYIQFSIIGETNL